VAYLSAVFPATYGSILRLAGNALAAHNTLIVSPKGVIVKEYIKVDSANHSEELLAALPTLQQSK